MVTLAYNMTIHGRESVVSNIIEVARKETVDYECIESGIVSRGLHMLGNYLQLCRWMPQDNFAQSMI